MKYNFGVYSDYNNETDYDQIFGECEGNIIVRHLEEYLYLNPIFKQKRFLNFRCALDGVMTLPQYMSIVSAVYSCCIGNHPKSDITSLFKNTTFGDIHYNQVQEKIVKGERAFEYKCITNDVVLTIIWGAYFLLSIKAAMDNKFQSAKEILYSFLLNKSGMKESDFLKKHVLMHLYQMHLEPTIKEIILASEEELRRNERKGNTKSPSDQSSEIDKDETSTNSSEELEDDSTRNFPNRLKVAYLLQLLGIKSKDQIDNQRALCRIVESITGVKRKQVQEYLNSFTLAKSYNQAKITQLNEDLKLLKLPLLQSPKLKCED